MGHWKPTRDTAGTTGWTLASRKNDGKDRHGAVDCDDMWTQVQDHLEVGLRFFLKRFLFGHLGVFMQIGKTNKDESVELSLSRIQKSALVQIPLKRKNIYNTVITVLTPFSHRLINPNLTESWEKKKHPKFWIILAKSQRRSKKKQIISDTLPKTNMSRRVQVPVSSKHMRLQNCL